MKSRIKTDLLSWLDFICRSSGILLCWVGLSFSSAQAATDCTQVTQIPQAECETLVALYKSTNGPNWRDSPGNNWNITNEPCQWQGVFCGDGHVALIDKGGTNLVGTLPDLSALTFLQSLILGFYTSQDGGHYNGSGTYQLTSTLPNLSALTHLTFLVLGGNQFTGTLNLSLFPSSLQSLHLLYNQLEGTIPSFKEKLPNLIHLDLSGNTFLTGPIDGSYFPMSLQLLRLNGISLNQSFPDLSSLTHLTHLELSNTQLSSSVSANYLPKSLVELDLNSNPLNQPIPDLSSLTNLTKLDLSLTQLTGSINPSFFPNSLQSLELWSYKNQLKGNFPNFSALKNLQFLSLGDSPDPDQLKGPIDASLFPLSLESLSLSHIPLNQPIPDLSNLINLNSLSLFDTQLTGTINLAYFPPNLTSIFLGRNQLQGIMPDFSKFNKLNKLGLGNNQLTSFIPDLSSLSELQHLDLSSNQLTGTIPTFPTSLNYLSLFNNHLSGNIPLSLTNLTNLYSSGLQLSYNHLNTTTTTEIHAFLEAPGNKDPDWAKTQTFSLLTCPQGGSFSIKPDPQQLNFGTELVGQTATLNLSTRAQDCGDFKLKGIQFVGDSKNEFALQSDPQQNCYDSDWNGHHYTACQLTIAFSPQGAGTKTDISLQFVFEPALDTTPISIQATAVSSGAPVIKVTPTEHAFGKTNLGSAINPQVFTLTNAGNISLKSPTFELTGANPLEFTFAGWGCNYKNILLPNEQESCELMAQFIPITPGDKQADLIIQSANAPALKVPLTGTAKIPEFCANITTESVNSGDWNDPATWSTNAIPREFDNVRINANHTIRGANSATINALCIADNGLLESFDNQGTSLILNVMSYLENKGIIRGQNGADQLATATTCNGDYWSTIGTPDCAQPGASLILSVGHNLENLLNNEGVIIAGRGGRGDLHHAYGGNVSVLGSVIVNHVTDTGCGIIKAGDGSLATPASAAERPGVPARCLDLLNQLTDAANDSDTAAPANSGRAGNGGHLTLWADSGLYSQGPVQVLAGNGGNCSAAQTQGGNGGRLRFNARQRVDLSGGYFAAGRGSTNCPQNGNSGAVGIEPSVISLAGAGTRIEGGDITIFGGDDWVLDLSHLDAAAIQADGDITLAVGKNGIIDLRGNSAAILKAGGQVKLFSDEILLESGTNLQQVIQAKNIVVGPNKILYDVSFLSADKFAAQPGSGLIIPLTLANNGPTVDTYTLTLTNPQSWIISELPATLEVKELSTYELPLQVTLPETRGASNSITVTATSQADPTVTATANILMTVAMEAVVVNPEQPGTINPEWVTLSPTVIVPMPTSNPCPDSGTINWLCDNRERTLTNATVAENASIAGGYLAGEIDNQGLISQVTIQPETKLTGGRLTGTIINQGTLANFNFVGARVVGGTLAGQITNTSRIEGYFQDVHLAADTQIIGGQLAGQISGDAQAPALLKQLAIKPGSHLEHVIIGDAVTLAADVTFGEGVQFQDPSQDPRLISPPVEELIPTETVTCDSELPALEVTATNSKGKTVETTAQANGGAAVNGGSFEPTVSVRLTDTVEVRGILCTEASQVGQSAEIVVYADYQPLDSTQAPAHYLLDNEGKVQLWDGKWEHLVALKSTVLESKQSVMLYQGVFPVTGEVALSFGYRLADGMMVANTKTIVVKIAP